MERFFVKLDQTAARLRQEAQVYAFQVRQDEADLTKIRANIYEICATVGRVVCRTQPPEKRRQDYLDKLENLPKSWQMGLQAAEAHGDQRQAVIQRLKLETLASIRENFCREVKES